MIDGGKDFTMASNPSAIELSTDAQDALNRMGRAYDRGTGCHLTMEMIDALAHTIVGEMWWATQIREGRKS